MDAEQPRRAAVRGRRYDDIRVQGVLFGFHYVPLGALLASTRPVHRDLAKNLEQPARGNIRRSSSRPRIAETRPTNYERGKHPADNIRRCFAATCSRRWSTKKNRGPRERTL